MQIGQELTASARPDQHLFPNAIKSNFFFFGNRLTACSLLVALPRSLLSSTYRSVTGRCEAV